jgi:hypothetical protein
MANLVFLIELGLKFFLAFETQFIHIFGVLMFIV